MNKYINTKNIRRNIGDSRLLHKSIHKATCVPPDHSTENHIDHICINKKFRRFISEKRRTHIASEHLVVNRLQHRLRKHKIDRKAAVKEFNRAYFRDSSKFGVLKIAINNRSRVLHDLLEEEENNTNSN